MPIRLGYVGGVAAVRVRRVRLEQMHPEKERLAGTREPRRRPGDGVGAGALGTVDLIVVFVEPARQSVALAEHDRADERARRIPGRLQHLRVGRDALREREEMVVAHAVRGRKQPREERRVRRQRERRHGDRLREVDRFRAKPLERRRAGADRVRAQRVDRHEHDRARRQRAAAAPSHTLTDPTRTRAARGALLRIPRSQGLEPARTD